MVCVVVTRGGAGDMWRHRALRDATDHPITQLGDAVCCSPEDVQRTFTVAEMATLAGRLDNPQLQRAAAAWASGRPDRASVERYSEQLWDSMRRLTRTPPEDPAEIVRLIREDRRRTRSAGGGVYRLHPEERQGPLRSTREPVMADENTEKKGAVRAKKYSDDGVITFGTDKDGNVYSAENNPKKAGSKAHAAFANYRDGETVKDLLARGGTTRGDVNYDAEKGYIRIG